MAIVRTFQSTAGLLAVRLPVGQVLATVDSDAVGITVVLRTADDTGAAAEAVSRATGRIEAGRYVLDVPDVSGTILGARRLAVSGVGVVGALFIYQTLDIVNGRITNSTFGNEVSAPGGSSVHSPVIAEIMLPPAVGLSFDGTAASLTTTGYLSLLDVRTVSGDVSAASVGVMRVSSVSGCVGVEAVFDSLDVRSVSGEVAVGSHQGRHALIGTTSGNVRINIGGTARGIVTARSLSGNVRVRGARHLAVTATTVSGSRRVE